MLIVLVLFVVVVAVWEVAGIEGTGGITFLEEPENKYDPNAIKVYMDGPGHIGYVPATETKRLKSMLSNKNEYIVKWELTGGKVKDISSGDEIRIKNLSYGVRIRLMKKVV